MYIKLFQIQFDTHYFQYNNNDNDDDDDGFGLLAKQQVNYIYNIQQNCLFMFYINLYCVLRFYMPICRKTYICILWIFYTYEHNLQLQYIGQILYGRMVAIIVEYI